ncbi:MAG: PQQ-binding-like beta-propeller repeat protein, partial [Planctomycetota bacterium]|nr:PQQ-binding-like beta-propeller repeat protein [Planctomycetota bacterium]
LPGQDIGPRDWPWWRGPQRNGIADANQNPPMSWGRSENLLWKAPIPGKGHGSPTILGNRVLITSADLERDLQTVICLDRQTGNWQWEAIVHRGGLKTRGNQKQNKKASLASTSVGTDGQLLFVNFLNQEAVWTTALTLGGKQVWQKKICNYVVHQGYGSSPAIYEDLVIVSADNKGGGMIKALKKSSGKTVWERSRPSKPNYPSPVIFSVAGKTQLLMTGCDRVTSLNPLTGKEFWEIEGATTECVATTVTDGKHIFTSGGYPKNHISAVAADGSGKVVWENRSRVYVPSMICHRGHLFAVLDAGIAVCYDSRTGEEKWKSRLAGNFSGSPILVGDRIYATSEKGETFIYRADPERFELLARNQLADSVLSTVAICGGRIFMRGAVEENGSRQEYLYCIGD